MADDWRDYGVPLAHTASLMSESGKQEIKALRVAFGTPTQDAAGNTVMVLPVKFGDQYMDIDEYVMKWQNTPVDSRPSEDELASMGLQSKISPHTGNVDALVVGFKLAKDWAGSNGYSAMVGDLGEYMATHPPFMDDISMLYTAWYHLRLALGQRHEHWKALPIALRTQQHAYMIKMIMQSLYHLQNRMKKLENMTQNTTEYPENVEFPALGQYPLTGSHGQTHHQPTQMPVQQSVPTATGMGYGGTGKSKWAKSPQNLSLAAFMDADTSKTMKTDPNGLPDVVTSDYWSTLNNLVENVYTGEPIENPPEIIEFTNPFATVGPNTDTAASGRGGGRGRGRGGGRGNAVVGGRGGGAPVMGQPPLQSAAAAGAGGGWQVVGGGGGGRGGGGRGGGGRGGGGRGGGGRGGGGRGGSGRGGGGRGGGGLGGGGGGGGGGGFTAAEYVDCSDIESDSDY
eukprot:1311026-Rhodomonas_salina.1